MKLVVHEGLKIPCLYGRAGSTPAPSTKKKLKKIRQIGIKYISL